MGNTKTVLDGHTTILGILRLFIVDGVGHGMSVGIKLVGNEVLVAKKGTIKDNKNVLEKNTINNDGVLANVRSNGVFQKLKAFGFL